MLNTIGFLLFILGVVDLILYYLADTILIPQILVFVGIDWTPYVVMTLGAMIAKGSNG